MENPAKKRKIGGFDVIMAPPPIIQVDEKNPPPKTEEKKIIDPNANPLANKAQDVEAQPFVWKKKEELKPDRKTLQQRKEEASEEIKKVRESRMRRYFEEMQRDEERARKEREKAREQFGDIETDDEFNLNQFFMSSEYRYKNRKYRQIDIVLSNFLVVEKKKNYSQEKAKKTNTIAALISDEIPYDPLLYPTLDARHTDPTDVLRHNTPRDKLLELREDIISILKLDKKPDTRKFWESLLILLDNELEKMNEQENISNNSNKGTKKVSGIHPEVLDDVTSTLDSQKFADLEEMETEVVEKLMHPDETVDVDYWENVRKCISLAKSRVYLKDYQEKILQAHEFFRNEIKQKNSSKQKFGLAAAAPPTKEVAPLPINDKQEEENEMMEEEEEENDNTNTNVLTEQDIMAEGDQLDEDDEEMDMFNDEITFENLAALTKASDSKKPNAFTQPDANGLFKPRYYNRIHTGFEWSKHNKMYYDPENPPPKIVQGYKFNIFYPDLKDKTKPPSYVIENDPQDKSNATCILKFKAGPPYQDIGFRIVKREWDKSHKHGFKCVFERGVLRLFFRFKKYKYRR